MNTNTKNWASITAGIISLAGYASAASIGSEKYTYDASGNIIEKSVDGKVTKIAYDRANRLVTSQIAGQEELIGNYDAAGRPLNERDRDNQPTRMISYGYSDKVIEAQTQDSKAKFYYNAEGLLVGKQDNGNVSTYTWDGNVLAADGIGLYTNESHITGGVPVIASNKYVIVSDYLGTSLASGRTKFSSTSYGEGLENGRLTGKPFIKLLGCFLFKNRMYSPELCQWTVLDPSGFPDGTNSKSYLNGDPVNRLDPNGLKAIIYRVHQDEVCTTTAYKDETSPNGDQCNISYTIGSDHNTLASAPTSVNLDPQLTQQTAATDPKAVYEGTPVIEYYASPSTDTTRTKYDIKVSADSTSSPSFVMKYTDFAETTRWIER